jgi:hypothetical protein
VPCRTDSPRDHAQAAAQHLGNLLDPVERATYVPRDIVLALNHGDSRSIQLVDDLGIRRSPACGGEIVAAMLTHAGLGGLRCRFGGAFLQQPSQEQDDDGDCDAEEGEQHPPSLVGKARRVGQVQANERGASSTTSQPTSEACELS